MSRESKEQLLVAELLRDMPECDLIKPGRFAWMGGRALGSGVLDDVAGHFHEEHESLIRARLDGVAAWT